jgi:integrase
VSASLLEEIGRHIEQFPSAEDGRVFTTNGAKGLLSHYQLNRSVAAAAARAGIHPPPNAHQLRDFAASILIKGHASVKQVQRFLGHSSAAMTLDKYVDLWPGELGELADIMEKALAATPGLVAVR